MTSSVLSHLSYVTIQGNYMKCTIKGIKIKVSLDKFVTDKNLTVSDFSCTTSECPIWMGGSPGFTKLHMGLVVLVKKMSVFINFLLQNTDFMSGLSKILVMSDRTDEFCELWYHLSEELGLLQYPSFLGDKI